MLFLGKHEYSMDERGRFPMPPRFRDALEQGVVLTQGTPDKCIKAFTPAGFEEYAALFMVDPPTTPRGRLMRRNLFAGTYNAEMDKQGRLLIPPPLRDFAGLRGHLVVMGAGDAIEIWDAEEFEKALEKEEPEFRQNLGSGEYPHLLRFDE